MPVEHENDGDPQEYRSLREDMVIHQLRRRGIEDSRVLRAMAEVPRHLFVPQHIRHLAYTDQALPIGQGQTISQPLMVATMLEALELGEDDRVLDVGTGAGYQAAVLGRLAREVVSVEIVDELVERARRNLELADISNVQVAVANGNLGHPSRAPYDGIVVAAAAPRVPEALVQQLADGGRLVIPVGGELGQTLQRIRKHGERTTTERLCWCAFVPLVSQ